VQFFSQLIDAFATAEGPPPRRFGAFVGWCLAGSWKIIGIAAVLSILIGLLEVGAFWVVGWVIDFVLAEAKAGIFERNWGVFAAIAVFFVILRPALMWLNASLQNLAVMNNIFPLIMSRLHRHTIGQSVSFFDDDFAGRIAQKQQQTARALADVVSEMLQAGAFCTAAVIGAAALVGAIHVSLGLILVGWALAVIMLVRWFIPRIRERAKDRAAARAMVTGQIVDTITNIRTVKLFATGSFEDQAALSSLAYFREKGLQFSILTVWFRASIMTLAGVLPVAMMGGAIWLWADDLASPGDIAAAAMVATRLAQMSGWASFTALGIFSNVGEIEDGIRTLAHDHDISDATNAYAPEPGKGRVTRSTSSRSISSRAKKLGWWGALALAKQRPPRCCYASTMWRVGAF